MSYKDYLFNNLNKLYNRYEMSESLIQKRLLENEIKINLNDLRRIIYEENYNFDDCSYNDL